MLKESDSLDGTPVTNLQFTEQAIGRSVNELSFKPAFIAIEGVDGSGKTTTAKLLANRLNGVYLKTAPKTYETICNQFDSSSNDNRARFLFYVNATCEAAENILQLISSGISVVADRWVLGQFSIMSNFWVANCRHSYAV